MNGQMKLSKKKTADIFIAMNRPYEQKKPLSFDLRAYSAYVEAHHLQAKDITPEILKMFEIV